MYVYVYIHKCMFVCVGTGLLWFAYDHTKLIGFLYPIIDFFAKALRQIKPN